MIHISKPIIGDEEIQAASEVLRSGMLAQGSKVALLEERFAEYCGTKYAVAVNSGTAALHSGLYALGVRPGDEAVTTPFTFLATANAIMMQGAKVVFADISEEDFNIDPTEVEKKITDKTKVILPVDLYGQVYRHEEVDALAKRYHLNILEDACQSIGASQNGVKAGGFGDVAAFSLYATKNIMCGEGGMVVTNDAEIAEKCKMFRHHGQSGESHECEDLGYNYRMTDLAAAIAIEQLKKVDTFNQKRIANATRLSDGLKDIRGVVVPKRGDGNIHVFHQYAIRITPEFKISRDELAERLREKEIGSGVYYRKPLHLHPYFMNMGYRAGDFPVAEKMASEVLSLPVHPGIEPSDIDHIIETIRHYGE